LYPQTLSGKGAEMPIKKIKECDVCKKQEPLEGYKYIKEPEWFMVNVSHVYCSKECWDKRDCQVKGE